MSVLSFSYLWLETMLSNTVGILAHRPLSIHKNENELSLFKLFFLASFFIVARYWRMNTAGFMVNQGIGIILAYGLFLMLYFNYYQIYLWCFAPLAVQGRYIFPVIVPLYGIIAYYLTSFVGKKLSILIVILVALFFIWGDYPYYKSHVNEDLYREYLIDNAQALK